MPAFTIEPIKIPLGFQGSIGSLGSLINPTIGVENAIVFAPELKNWQSTVRYAFLEGGIGPYNAFALDHVVRAEIGDTTYDSTGRRHNAAELITYANPSNIKVAVYATIERLLVASSPAIGVIFRDHLGRFHHAMLKGMGEILFSAGAIGSPQLLILSGIGRMPYLNFLLGYFCGASSSLRVTVFV